VLHVEAHPVHGAHFVLAAFEVTSQIGAAYGSDSYSASAEQ